MQGQNSPECSHADESNSPLHSSDKRSQRYEEAKLPNLIPHKFNLKKGSKPKYELEEEKKEIPHLFQKVKVTEPKKF